jgi:hypothetical protein
MGDLENIPNPQIYAEAIKGIVSIMHAFSTVGNRPTVRQSPVISTLKN